MTRFKLEEIVMKRTRIFKTWKFFYISDIEIEDLK